MAELDIEKLLFSDSDVDATPGDFELKFEIDTESTFSDDDLVEAIESYETSQNPSDTHLGDNETDAQQTVTEETAPPTVNTGPPTAKSKDRFPNVTTEEIEGIIAGATSSATNKMTRWGVQQFKRMSFFTKK